MDIPKIETLGYNVCEVQGFSDVAKKFATGRVQHEIWFKHRGVWFDGTLERTERYLLYEIPFLKERCKNIKVFKTNEAINKAVLPFKEKQQALKDEYDKAHKH